jgi:hypothetical protein
MRTTARFFVLALAAVMMMALAVAPASAQVDQEGLVNVNVGDVTAQVPVAVAANVCNVAVGVLAEQAMEGPVDCEAVARSQAQNNRGADRSNSPVHQDGLVNVNLGDVVVQVPITVAANACNIGVGVLARQVQEGDVTCDAVARGQAQNR